MRLPGGPEGSSMAHREVREWLQEYKSLSSADLPTYVSVVRQKDDLYADLCDLLEGDLTDEYIEPVCHQLFEFFKSGQAELKLFTLELLPSLVYVYLTAISRAQKRYCSGLEACLLGMYNLEVIEADGHTPKKTKFTIPTLAFPSIYHEPPSLASLALNESSILRYHSDTPIPISLGPLPQEEAINAQNRLTILQYVLSLYTHEIKHLSPRSHSYLCTMCSRLARQGFMHLEETSTGSRHDTSSSSQQLSPRIPLSQGLLTELLSALYYTMFNGLAHPSIEAVNVIHKRAAYERFTDVLLVTNAIRNSLQFNPSGQPTDGPMGIAVAISPFQRDDKLNKFAITNASFRGKRLPEDIEVVTTDAPTAESLPPHYDDVTTSENSHNNKEDKGKEKGASHMIEKKLEQLSHPLKSIIKKNSERDKEKSEKLSSTKLKRETSSLATSSVPAAALVMEQAGSSPARHLSPPATVGPTTKVGDGGGSKHRQHFFPSSQSYTNGDVSDINHITVQLREGGAQKRPVDNARDGDSESEAGEHNTQL